jgi:pyruvate/2-oxoacid:ferredoxin oxidoreductase alpha subunit
MRPGEGMAFLGWALVAVAVLNALFTFAQAIRAERAMQALRSMLPQRITVRRSGVEGEVPIEALVPGDVLLLSWGGTFGSVRGAAEELVNQGKKVGHVHLRWLNPLPANLGQLLKSFKKVFVPEVNDGQLATYLRSQFPGIDPVQFNRINGKPLKIAELAAKVIEIL